MKATAFRSYRRLALFAMALVALFTMLSANAHAVCTTYQIVTTGLDSRMFPITFHVDLTIPSTGQTFTETRVINSAGVASFPQPRFDMEISQFDLKLSNNQVGLWTKYDTFPDGPHCSGFNNACFTVSISPGTTCIPTITLAPASCSGVPCCPPPFICP
jgi:hypothetical protein